MIAIIVLACWLLALWAYGVWCLPPWRMPATEEIVPSGEPVDWPDWRWP